MRFVHLLPDQVNHAIEEGLQRVSTFLGVHSASLWQGSFLDLARWRLTHVYQDPDHVTLLMAPDGAISPRGGWTLLTPSSIPYRLAVELPEYFPWVASRLSRDEKLVINSLEDLPDEAARDRATFLQIGIRSALVIPIVVGKQVFGITSFHSIGEERRWTKDVVDDLCLVSQCFGNALARKVDDQALREREEYLSLAAASAGIVLWSVEVSSGAIWFSDAGGEWFDQPSGELSLTRFLAAVHPEDRARVKEAYRASTDSLETEVEYRLLRPDGGMRWVVSRGRRVLGPTARPERVMGVTLDVTERKAMETQIVEQLREIRRLKERCEQEALILRDELQASRPTGAILGTSDAIKYVRFRIGQVAPLDSNVLIQGETGTGKNLAAAAIHAQSRRKDRPMITVSCAALPGNLIESELFGRDRGAFTGADQTRLGRFEIADGSTIFLDEIGDLPLDLQAKLLRVVQTGELEHLGSSKTVKVDVRVIAASNRNLGDAVREKQFRADLFFRLNVFPITMPPLRARKDDIPLLAQALVEKIARRVGRPIRSISEGMLRRLQEYDWPGNVRELENVVERAVILSTGPILELAEPICKDQFRSAFAVPEERAATALGEVEREHIRRVLRTVGWRLEGKGGAADLLGLNPSTLRARMRKLRISRESD